jgi:PAS domain S-box-containing protein
MQLQKVIEQLGYSGKEAKVYLAALALGEAHISDIASKVGMPRSSVQTIVDKLRRDGLMTFYVQRRYKYWVAENPERLLANLRRREETMQSAMPRLEALRRSSRGSRRAHSASQSLGVLQGMAGTALQPVLITDENAQILYVNGAWEGQFGYELEEVRGENPRILQSEKTPRGVYERMWATLKAGKLFQSDEIVDKRKDGTLFSLLTTILPVTHDGSVFYIQILDDISARKRAEALGERFARVNR